MKSVKYMLPFAAALLFNNASAEEQLSKEITIEREIVPEVRAASRLNVFPETLNFKPQGNRLSISDFSETTDDDPTIATCSPAATVAAVTATPWRGYVNAGYFPAANAGVSAGYGIISDSDTRLNVWGQFNSIIYKEAVIPDAEKTRFRNLAGRLGVDFAHRFGKSGVLLINTDFGITSIRNAGAAFSQSMTGVKTENDSESALEWNLEALWRGNTGSWGYHAGAYFGLFNFSNSREADEMLPVCNAVHQKMFGVGLGISKSINNNSAAGVDIAGDFLSFNHFMGGNGRTLGVASLKPYYKYANNVVTLKAGVSLDFTIKGDKVVHIAPDVLVGVNPASGFGGWIRFGGGEHLNSLQSLQAFSPYISQAMAYGVSHRPVTGDLGLRFGPLHGASLTLRLAYASANDWLLPAVVSDELVFFAHNLRTWKAGVQVNWKFRSLLTFEASFESTLGNGDRETWIEWRDRARHVLGASIDVNPIRPLTINLAYQLRMKRSMPLYSESVHEEAQNVNLKDFSNLSLGATWRFTDFFSVFARVDNLLDTKAFLLPTVPGQGVNGLVGVSLKF